MSDLPERLRELAGAIGNCEWELPLCAASYCLLAADEMERLRSFARRIYVASGVPAWAHDQAAKLLDEPSLAHGCDDQSR